MTPSYHSSKKARRHVDWIGEARGAVLMVLGVLAFHSLVAKPFYIPSESMLPGLLKGDRLVVTKFPYGWSYVSPSFHVLPFINGRLFGRLPERGDIVIVKPPLANTDYIKRVIGLPGDRIEVHGGAVILNGRPLKRRKLGFRMLPMDANSDCDPEQYPDAQVLASDGKGFCRLPIVRETLPSGRYYDTVDLGPSAEDDVPPVVVPEGHVFLMGDNRDRSADSRVPAELGGLGGPLPIENLGGRAEMITFSLDGSTQILNPLTWWPALRGGRAGTSLHPQLEGRP